MRVTVVGIVRRGKFHTRVKTSDKRQLLLDNDPVPFVGMELPIEAEADFVAELRPLRRGDEFPGLIDSCF
jgi:hypothetical protein